MANNEAIILTVGSLLPIEGADRIVKAEVFLNGVMFTQVVTGKDQFQVGEKVVYFDANLVLSDWLLAKDPKLAVYLAKGNRVKCIKLKGTVSNGLVLSRDLFFPALSHDRTPEGFTFTYLNGTEICRRYVAPVKASTQSSGNKKGERKMLVSRVIPSMFNFHIDTAQLLRNTHAINPGSVISISRKIHGTSFITSYTQVKKKLSFLTVLAKKLGVEVRETEYDYLYASRNVIKNDLLEGGFYDSDVWTSVGEKYFKGKLHKGETVYGEAYGYLPSGAYIQKPFDYGCRPGETKIQVYRITLTSEDGTIAEYDWAAMKERCVELGAPVVEEFYYGRADQLFQEVAEGENWNKNFIFMLKETFLEKDCPYCFNKCPDEGIVVRVSGLYIRSYKLKSERFTMKESELREKEDFTDVEDAV